MPKLEDKSREHYCFRCNYRGEGNVHATKQLNFDIDIAPLYVCDDCSYGVTGIMSGMLTLRDLDKKDREYWGDKL